MGKKMTKQDLQNYIISEATKLYKIEVLKERKENIDKQLKLLSEGNLDENLDFSSRVDGELVKTIQNLLNNYIQGKISGNQLFDQIAFESKDYDDNLYSPGGKDGHKIATHDVSGNQTSSRLDGFIRDKRDSHY